MGEEKEKKKKSEKKKKTEKPHNMLPSPSARSTYTRRFDHHGKTQAIHINGPSSEVSYVKVTLHQNTKLQNKQSIFKCSRKQIKECVRDQNEGLLSLK